MVSCFDMGMTRWHNYEITKHVYKMHRSYSLCIFKRQHGWSCCKTYVKRISIDIIRAIQLFKLLFLLCSKLRYLRHIAPFTVIKYDMQCKITLYIVLEYFINLFATYRIFFLSLVNNQLALSCTSWKVDGDA